MNKRGRPKKYDKDLALQQAMQVFWQQGYSATSLDDLSAAMGMNRPSIYIAFGSKADIYRQSLAAFCGQLDQALTICLDADSNLRESLMKFFDGALEVYCGLEPAMGCLMICTAPAECLNSEEIAHDLQSLILRVDKALEKRIREAIKSGHIAKHVDAKLLAMHLQATLQTIAIRSRAGADKRSLKKYVRFALDQIAWI